MISVILRTKNEEKWIARCLKAVTHQDLRDFEVIVVDTHSEDRTVSIARRFGCRILQIHPKEFSYGRSLNWGIAVSGGSHIAILSAHCIPLNNKWLERLYVNFTSDEIAATYGRQEPLPDSNMFDKRDLWMTFGLDRRVQVKDYFFHNANAMIRRDIWEKVPFDETVSGVEDRTWAKKVMDLGHRIVYEPQASVYHYHGIHQGRNEERCARVVKVIEWIHNGQQPQELTQ